ncbi:MAG: biotin/lipoyl-containing protein, partial [Bdellovibrionota bacterium]
MEFKLPDIGEGVVEGELIQWLVKEGDTVAADQPVVEVMTDKATVEVPAPVGGKITGIKAKEGDMIKIGQTLAQIDGGAAAAKAPEAKAPAQEAKAPVEKTVEKTDKPSGGEGAGRDQTSAVPASNGASVSAPASKPASQAAPSAVGSYSSPASLSPSDVPAAPLVRSMAQKAGVDLSQVTATGPKVGTQSRVLEEDLLRFLNQGAGATQAGTPTYVAQGAAPAAQAPKKIKPIPASYFRDTSGVEPQDERQPVRGLR